jgi:hypothetical protein
MSWTIRNYLADPATVMEIDQQGDRTAAIMAGGYLEDFLAMSVKKLLVDDAKVIDDFFAGMGPLSSFSAKIDMAYLLRLVDDENRKRMHIIRRIRNDFAHDLSPLTFKSKRVADRCRALFKPNDLRKAVYDAQHKGLGPIGNAKGDSRRIYLTAIKLYVFYLDAGIRIVTRNEPFAPGYRRQPANE